MAVLYKREQILIKKMKALIYMLSEVDNLKIIFARHIQIIVL